MPKPNLLFLLSDEHSYRFLSALKNDPVGEEVETPNLDRLIAGGTHFTDAYCQMPLCTPSRISLLTGLLPQACGAWSNESVLRPELPTIGSVFGDAGYKTALIGKMHLGGRAQFAGFQERPYGDLTGKTGHQWEPIDDADRHGMRARTAKAGVSGIPESLLQEQITAQETVAWIREQEAADKPWFALASFSRPHFPLTAPKRWIDYYRRRGISKPKFGPGGDAFDHPMSAAMRKGFRADEIDHDEMMEARLGYFACVSYLDEVIGDLIMRLDASGSLDNTVIVYTTDHGEMAGEHGVWWKNGWYEACTRVPLVISTPEQRRTVRQGAGGAGANAPGGPAQRCSTPVGLIDLLPTICRLCNVQVPAHFDGRDISPALTGGSLEEVPVTIDALVPRWGPGTEFRAVRQGRFKYVRFRNAEPLAFDVVEDPGERRNLLSRVDRAAARPAAVGDGKADPGTTAGGGDTGSVPPDAAKLDALRAYAESGIDFDRCEKDRLERDGGLKDEYALDLPEASGNLYIFPSGDLVDADNPMLYKRTVVARSAEEAFTREPL